MKKALKFFLTKFQRKPHVCKWKTYPHISVIVCEECGSVEFHSPSITKIRVQK